MDEQSIFLAALERKTPEAQAQWLAEACGTDDALRARVAALLQSHREAHSFLEHPPAEFEATLVHDPAAHNLAGALEAGLSPAFDQNQALVIGSASHSVLRSLSRSIDVPRVILRDAAETTSEPIVRPTSAEMPQRDPGSRYQLQGEIARGGMGAILKGRDIDLGRDLAIKVLLDAHKGKPEVVQRFVEEAQIGGQLQHPGIAPVYELGQFADSRPFFSMKLVKGETLSKLLAARAETLSDRGKFLGIFEQICQTMAYAHSRGVIHRDLKPANIMVGAFGEVQVMDWGLAKVLPAGGVADEKKSFQKHQGQSIIQTLRSQVGSDAPGAFGSIGSQTQMGSVMGTPAYMPPEQALGEIDHLDERADLFGLGAILCEILTGKPPYVSDDATEVFRMASRGKLTECFERLDRCVADAELISLTKHCLALEPDERPRDAGVLTGRVTGYLESVEAKLRSTELERAAEAARADAQAAQAEAERQRAEAEGRRAEAERERAQSETRRLEQQQHSARKLRKLIAGLSAVALVAGLACVAALIANQRANMLAEVAAREANKARHNEAIATQSQQETKQALGVAAASAENLARHLYINRVNLAYRECLANDIATADRLLDACDPARRGWEWDYCRARCHLESLSFHVGNSPDDGALSQQSPRARPRDAVYRPDGHLIAVAATDGTIRLCDPRTGRESAVLHGHVGQIESLAFDRSGQRIVSGGHDQTVRIWDLSGAREPIVLRGHTHVVSCVDFSPAGDQVASTDTIPAAEREGGCEFKQWDAATGQEIRTLHHQPGWNSGSVAYSADGRRLATTSLLSPAVHVWDAAEGTLIASVERARRQGHMSFSPRDGSLAVCSDKNEFYLWSPDREPDVQYVHGHTSDVTDVAFSPDGGKIASGGSDGTVRVWGAESRREIATFRGHAGSVISVAFSPDGRKIVSTGDDSAIKVWEVEGPSEQLPHDLGGWGFRTAFCRDGQRLAVARWAKVLILDAKTGQLVCEIKMPDGYGGVIGFAFTPDGKRAVTSSEYLPSVIVWDTETGARLLDLALPSPHIVPAVAASPDGRFIVTASQDGSVRFWDARTGGAGPVLDGHSGGALAIAFDPAGRRVATCGRDGVVRLWDTTTGQPLRNFSGIVQDDVSYLLGAVVAFDRAGKRLAATSAAGLAYVWDLDSAGPPLILRGHSQRVNGIAFGPGSNRITTASFDQTIKLWDDLTGEEVLTLRGHTGGVLGLAVSPDGRQIGSTGTDQTVRLWSVQSVRD